MRIVVCLLCLTGLSCTSTGRIQEAPIPIRDAQANANETEIRPTVEPDSSAPRVRGVADVIRSLTELGDLVSMQEAIELIRNRELGNTEFGRVMSAVNITLIKRIYPDEGAGLPAPDFPQAHLYARIIRSAEQGSYTKPPLASTDYLEHVLPFLAFFDETQRERLITALPDLLKAEKLKPNAIIAPYFCGLVYERIGQLEEASAAYNRALHIATGCYPATLGLARVLQLSGKIPEALEILTEVSGRYPDNNTIKRRLAAAWYEAGDWAKAEPVIMDILRQEGRNGQFMLMRAHMLVEAGQYTQAQALLDQYAAMNPNTRLYLFLRARIQAESLHNRTQALTFLRSLLRSFPNDEEAMLYTAGLLLESSATNERTEGRELLRQLLQDNSTLLPALSLSLQDAVNRESWQEAQRLLQEILPMRRSGKDIYNAYLVERGLGNNSRALSYARELYEQDRTSDEGITVYISALIDSNRKEEAAVLIERRLATLGSGPAKSNYLYLRSRTSGNEEAALSDLRLALFEDPRNLAVLIAMFEIYHNRRDTRRAVYYLKQAIAIAPSNPQLKRYAGEYSVLMGN